MASNDRDALTSALGAFLYTIKKGVESSAMDTIVRMDLTLTQVRVIMMLKDVGAETPISEISERLGLSLATTGRAVDHLVKHDMATRWEDPADRRSKLVQLTEQAEEITEAQQNAALDRIRGFCQDLPDEVADELLAALRHALDAAPSSTSPPSCVAGRRPRTSSYPGDEHRQPETVPPEGNRDPAVTSHTT